MIWKHQNGRNVSTSYTREYPFFLSFSPPKRWWHTASHGLTWKYKVYKFSKIRGYQEHFVAWSDSQNLHVSEIDSGRWAKLWLTIMVARCLLSCFSCGTGTLAPEICLCSSSPSSPSCSSKSDDMHGLLNHSSVDKACVGHQVFRHGIIFL